MSWIERALLFSTLDYVSLAALLVAWLIIGWRIEHSSADTPSVSKIMAEYRRDWLREMVTRDNRIFDAQIIASLRQGTAFFASTSMIALGGVLAVIGNADRLTLIAGELIQNDAPTFVWEVKLVLVTLFLTNAFLKFVWANRLFGYASVLMAAVPNDPNHEDAVPRAKQAAEINVIGAQNFNRGLRSVYFALASIAWMAGPLLLMTATLFTVAVIWRREFASNSRKVLLNTKS